jgi:hypothetical protein
MTRHARPGGGGPFRLDRRHSQQELPLYEAKSFVVAAAYEGKMGRNTRDGILAAP